jgi:16S rRNA (uracil1498-N3)-methyltransferase
LSVESLILQSNHALKLIAHCEEDQKNPLQQVPAANNTLVLIGPEGDFSKEEIALAIHNSFVPVSLGETRLRTETAGVVAITLLANPISPLS